MRAFLKYVTRGRFHAIFVAVVSLLVPPFSFLAGAIVGLVTLRYGVGDGLFTLASSVLLAGGLTLVMLGTADPAVGFLLVTGVPVLLLAALLRLSSSQGVVLAGAGVLGGLVLSAIHLLTADPELWWRELLRRYVFDGALAHGNGQGDAALERVDEILDVLAPVMLSLPAGAAIAAVIVLFLARWWHATLDNPGGFGIEFRGIALDRRVALVAAVIGAIALVAQHAAGGYWPGLLQMMVVLFTVQGVAITHSIVAGHNASLAWLIGMYMLLLLRPREAIIVLAVAGYSDTWIHYRRRWGRSA